MKRRIAHPRPWALVPAALTMLVTVFTAHVVLADAPVAAAAKPARAQAHATAPAKQARAKSTHKQARTASRTLTGASGMKAAIDPATGRLVRPTAEQVQALDALAGVRRAVDDDPSRGIAIVRLANGTEMAQLDERFHEFEVASIGADGKLVRTCVQGPDAAAKVRADAKAKAATPRPAKELQ